MEVYRRSSWLLLLLGLSLLATTLQGVQGEAETEGPSESECRPYIEKALKELETGEAEDPGAPADGDSKEDIPTVEITTDDSDHEDDDGDDDSDVEVGASTESVDIDQEDQKEATTDDEVNEQTDEQNNEQVDDSKSSEEEVTENSKEVAEEEKNATREKRSVEEISAEKDDDQTESEDGESYEDHKESEEDNKESQEEQAQTEEDQKESVEDDKQSADNNIDSVEDDKNSTEDEDESAEGDVHANKTDQVSVEVVENESNADSKEGDSTEDDSKADSKEGESVEDDSKADSKEDGDSKQDDTKGDSKEKDSKESAEKTDGVDSNESNEAHTDNIENDSDENDTKETESNNATVGDSKEDAKNESTEENATDSKDQESKLENIDKNSKESDKDSKEGSKEDSKEDATQDADEEEKASKESEEDESAPEEDLSEDIEIPEDLRPTEHITQLLKLDNESFDMEKNYNRAADITLRELKKLYENAIKPLEVLYKYRDLSNRHFGDSEIFSKPLVLFMGPWSGGKSSIINYLLDNEYNETTLRTGAEPSPAYFNILMHGDEPEVLDGTQLAADYTFSGLQKFGQGLEERLRGLKLPSKLLEKINIVEIPGILEVRKQVSRMFPFNDACQWFIDRADIIFLVYDPSKLDVGPETEAILDQLKGREYQTRIILNKADQVKPEELMRVQGALIWNISPLMSSAQPPVMYTTSLWSRPYEIGAPVRLLHAQERAFLRDLRSAVDKRIENKISSARRFAVRVRNHAKMVDCYLTTYYNHKSLFGNRKQVSDQIIDHPQNYHIYEGLSTLTNISRYDLPDPEVYRGFFKLNPLYEFQQLSATCTYFRGCPINKLDVAIAYDLPELVGRHKRLVEAALVEPSQAQTPGS